MAVAVTVLAVLGLFAAVWEPLESLMRGPFDTAMTIHGESTVSFVLVADLSD